MEQQLDRIATAFERIASVLESICREGLEVYSRRGCLNINGNLSIEGDLVTSLNHSHLTLEGPLVVQHEFTQDVPLGLLYVEPNERAFKVELSNCTDTETPFAVQVND